MHCSLVCARAFPCQRHRKPESIDAQQQLVVAFFYAIEQHAPIDAWLQPAHRGLLSIHIDNEKSDTALTVPSLHATATPTRLLALLELGAGVDSMASDGASALCIACYAGHADIVRLALGAGASLDRVAARRPPPRLARGPCCTQKIGQ